MSERFGDGIDWDAEALAAVRSTAPVPTVVVAKLRAALADVDRPALVDCGCNVGRFWIPVLDAGFDYSGVDQSAVALSAAKQAFIDSPRGGMTCGSLVQAMLWDEWPRSFGRFFDAALCSAVLQHNHCADQWRILARVAEAVRPGGFFAMQETTLAADEGRIEDSRCHSRATWARLVEEQGFELVDGWRVAGEQDDGYLFRRIGGRP